MSRLERTKAQINKYAKRWYDSLKGSEDPNVNGTRISIMLTAQGAYRRAVDGDYTAARGLIRQLRTQKR